MKMPGRKFFIPLLILAIYFGGRAWYFTPSVGKEDQAKNFTAVRSDGLSFSLKELRGNYVLLDFWGSWCGPCRRESPALIRLHQSLGQKLTIISVAIERDSADWLRASRQDGRNWPYQVMDKTNSLKFLGGEIATVYGVKQVPTNFLIDPMGKVLGVDVALSSIKETIISNPG